MTCDSVPGCLDRRGSGCRMGEGRVGAVIRGFSHLQLVVTDLDRSARWYTAALGVVEFARGELADGAYVALRHPEAGFVIGMQTATPEQRPGLGSSAIDHLSFGVADREALERVRAVMLDAAIDAGPIFDEAVSHNCRLRDPDGLVVELTAPKRATVAPAG